jgi:hypothetical protein
MKKPSAENARRKSTFTRKVSGTDVSQRGRVDYLKLTAQLGGKFRSMELWKLVLDRE